MNCNQLRIHHCGEYHVITGWIKRIRTMGGVCFIDVGDKHGVTQVVVRDKKNIKKIDKDFSREDVATFSGRVRERSNKNSKMDTGDVELDADMMYIINKCENLPFTIVDETDGGEELRMRNRYLDLRRPKLQKNLMFRHRLALKFRNILDELDFMEIETPYLIKPTPEGAKDFVVPTEKGVYALPQSPQLMKQMLMVAGMDRYFQITRCFRDEPLRKDRQPEFTQVDCEMSFVNHPSDVRNIFTPVIQKLFKDLLNYDLSIDVMKYDDAIEHYGSDKPDTRFKLLLKQNGGVKNYKVNFMDFNDAHELSVIHVPQFFTNSEIKKITEEAKSDRIGLGNLFAVKVDEEENITSSISKHIPEEKLRRIIEKDHKEWDAGERLMKAPQGTYFLSTHVKYMKIKRSEFLKRMGLLRLYLAKITGVIDEVNRKKLFKALWVIQFPAFEEDSEGNISSVHHPFTKYDEWSYKRNKKNLERVYSDAYDLVINGQEIGGGSIRIHNAEDQIKAFEILGMSQKEIDEKFGFFIKALKSGAPPHGGIAFGLDRLCAVMNHQESIRDFIAFPKNNQGKDTTFEAPTEFTEEQRRFLNYEGTDSVILEVVKGVGKTNYEN